MPRMKKMISEEDYEQRQQALIEQLVRSEIEKTKLEEENAMLRHKINLLVYKTFMQKSQTTLTG